MLKSQTSPSHVYFEVVRKLEEEAVAVLPHDPAEESLCGKAPKPRPAFQDCIPHHHHGYCQGYE